MEEKENLIGCAYTNKNIFLENVIDDTLEGWSIDDFIYNMPKNIDTSYIKIFYQNNNWYAYYDDNTISKAIFLEDTLRELYEKTNEKY